FALAAFRQDGDTPEDPLLVDRNRRAVGGLRQIDRVAARRVRNRQHLDPLRLDRPQRLAAAHAAGAVRRAQLLLDRAGEHVEIGVAAVLDQQRAVGQGYEPHGVALDAGRIHGHDRVRLARTVEPGDAGLLPERTRVTLRRALGQSALARELLVQRLAPEEAHPG